MPDATGPDVITPPRQALSLSDTIDLICIEVSAINANLEALLDELRRERAQEVTQPKENDK